MKILLVDDEPAVLSLAAMILQTAGYTIFKAVSALEAADICSERSAELDLIIVDVSIPGMIELAERASETETAIPLILMSGYASDSPNVVRMAEQGKLTAWSFLPKPFMPRQLLEIVGICARKV